MRENRTPRIYYATQVGTAPPTIVLFVNSPQLFDATYQRYLLNVFREKLPFRDIPIKLYLRARKQTEPGAASTSGGGDRDRGRTHGSRRKTGRLAADAEADSERDLAVPQPRGQRAALGPGGLIAETAARSPRRPMERRRLGPDDREDVAAVAGPHRSHPDPTPRPNAPTPRRDSIMNRLTRATS